MAYYYSLLFFLSYSISNVCKQSTHIACSYYF